MSFNLPCPILRCCGCEKPIDTKRIRSPQRRYNIRCKVRAGKPIYCNTRCFRYWFTYRTEAS